MSIQSKLHREQNEVEEEEEEREAEVKIHSFENHCDENYNTTK